ncbi:BgTH12-05200 [Blumeria graminis f. sp. triticale]|uniref:BgTH12-05200 n=1 Tax=Blumeria graminis f. sp. triticale TaxID=1689686 RepID=A0A9W4D1V6_BLUGR|nr:BgTH12-05200 [Blumeria graminis f. sp. triticale]
MDIYYTPNCGMRKENIKTMNCGKCLERTLRDGQQKSSIWEILKFGATSGIS